MQDEWFPSLFTFMVYRNNVSIAKLLWACEFGYLLSLDG